MGQNKKTTQIVDVEYKGRAATIFTIIETSETASKVLDEIGVVGKKKYDKCPNTCPICDSKKMTTLELIGVAERPLFWECDDCQALFCIEERKWIEGRIKKLDGLWTTFDCWDVPDTKDFN